MPMVQTAGTLMYYLITKVEFVGTGAFFVICNILKNLYYSKANASDVNILIQRIVMLEEKFLKNQSDVATDIKAISDNISITNANMQTSLEKIIEGQNIHTQSFTEEIEKRNKMSNETNTYLTNIQSNVEEVQKLLEEETTTRKQDTQDHKDSLEKANQLLASIVQELSELKTYHVERKEKFTEFTSEQTRWRDSMQKEQEQLLAETKELNTNVSRVFAKLENNLGLSQN